MPGVNHRGGVEHRAAGQLRVRMYEPGDREQVFRLWEDFIAPARIERRKEIFLWLTERNPALGGRSPYHVVVDGDRVVGHYGRMPVRFLLSGRQVDGYVCHDIYVHRRYRGKDAAVSEALVRELERSDSFVLALWFAPMNLALHRRCGWREIGSCDTFVKVFRPEPFLRQRLGPALRHLVSSVAAVALRLADRRLRPPAGSVVRDVTRFDDRFDGLAREAGAAVAAVALRDGAYLDWKYGRRPHMTYRVLQGEQGGRLRAYIVFRVDRSPDGRKGLILDMLAAPGHDELLAAMVASACAEMREEGVDYVACAASHPTARRTLRRNRFLRSPSPSTVMIAAWEGRVAQEEAAQIGRWYLTRGDGDGDFWTTREEGG